MPGGELIDLQRVVCALTDLEENAARAFTIGEGDWPLRGFVVRTGAQVHGYRNVCPHSGHPLDLIPGRFLTADRLLILCSSHGALFEKATGLCVAGPCPGRYLRRVALEVRSGLVMVAEGVALEAPEDLPRRL